MGRIKYRSYDELGPEDFTQHGQRRCEAKSRQTKERCKRPVTPGTNVCYYHGGNAKQTKAKAQLRLASLTDAAISTLAREMVSATKSSDKIKAANSILDRAGMPREIKGMSNEDAVNMLIAQLHEVRRNQLEASPHTEDSETIEDAEVIEN